MSERERGAVTVLGLGYMGSALARTLLTNHYELTVWNRTASKAQALVDAGATLAASVGDAVVASDVIVVCVTDYASSHDLLAPSAADGSMRGKTLIQLTTGTPEEARSGATWAAANGVDYLDGAIMEAPQGVGTPEGTFLYSGSQAVFEANQPLLLCLGGNSMYLGDAPGNASALDCSLLSFLYSTWIGFLHGAALCESEGMSIESYAEASLPVLPGLVTGLLKSGAEMASRRSYESTVATLNANTAALEHIVHFCDESGVDRAIPAGLVATLKKAKAAGYGEDDLAAVFEVFRKPGVR